MSIADNDPEETREWLHASPSVAEPPMAAEAVAQ
jgi:hypothetical protein